MSSTFRSKSGVGCAGDGASAEMIWIPKIAIQSQLRFRSVFICVPRNA
jgi:hypothetical protein